mgnify:CR=1 FL=1
MTEPITSIVSRVQKKQSTAEEQVTQALQRANEYNDEHNIFISILHKSALKRAKEIDARLSRGEKVGKLAGVPFVAKDNFLTTRSQTTAASHILKNYTAPLQATAIERLEAEGAICIGKTNLDAFAHGSSTENSAFGPTKNAIDTTRVAGGSSGGSAVAVALGIVPFALGTDTGGSIRQPASFNGVVGVKPTYGTISRYGVVAMASSTDCIGPITASCDDAQYVMSILAGKDAKDPTTLPDFWTPQKSIKKLRIGIIKDCFNEQLPSDMRKAVTSFCDTAKTKGHDIKEVELPMIKYAIAMYYIIVPAEISSNLARYDGVRYGRRAAADTLSEVYGKSRDEGFMPENKRRIILGSYVLSSGFYEAYYNKAQKARTLLINQYNALFEESDILISPVAPTTAFKLEAFSHDPLHMYLADAMTVPASLAGLPAVSVPWGTDADKLPIGIQLVAHHQNDATMLAFGAEMEKSRG